MAINATSGFTADIQNFIRDELLPVAQRTLVLYQLGDPATLPEGMGLTFTATRYNRIPLPYAPLSEGVPPIGETLTISQVTAVCQQWGDAVRITDLAELNTKHPLMATANELIGIQVGELLERNAFNALLGGTQVNYVNSRGSRAALTAGDVLDTHTVNRTVVALDTIGAYKFNGPMDTDLKMKAAEQASKAYKNPAGEPHYVGIMHTLVKGDIKENAQVVLASSYSNVNYLYNSEAGWWAGMRFCASNLVPTWTGQAQISATAVPTGGSFAASTLYIIVTGSDTQNQYESQIYQVSTSTATVVLNGSITVVLPSTTGYTYSVYVGTTASPTNLGLSASGPTNGPLQGQATQMAPGQTVTITGTGMFQVPPAAPTTGVTVYPTFVIGRGYFANVKLKDVEITWLDQPDKSDWLNQLRIVGWKATYGELITNAQFGARIESASAFTSTFG